MSTPAGKPFDQTSPPASPSRRLNEQPSAENQPASDSDSTSPSAYAPKRLRVVEPAATQTSTDDMSAAPRFLTRENKPREQRVEPRLFVEPVDGPMRLHSLQSATEHASADPGTSLEEKDDLERLEASLRWLKDQDVRGQSTRSSLSASEARPIAIQGQRPGSAI